MSNLSQPTTPLSPSHPLYVLQPSPAPTTQVLQDTARNLQVIESIQAVKPNWAPLQAEEVFEGQVVASADNTKVADMPDDAVVVDFEDENGVDDDRALQESCRTLEKFSFDLSDLDFTFNQVEIKMSAVGARKQYTKLQALSTILPKNVIDQVKKLLRKKKITLG